MIQGYFCPVPPMALRIKRIAAGKYIYTVSGIEKKCSRCSEFWPIDTEFFFSCNGKGDGLTSCCKACYLENRYPERYGLPAIKEAA